MKTEAPPPASPAMPTGQVVIVGLFLGLMVARLQLPGNDPGRLSLTTGKADIVWNLLLLMVTALAAVHAALRGYNARLFNLPALCLMLIGILSVASTYFAADYKRPGWRISSNWFVALVVYLLARALPSDSAFRSRLLTLLLVTVLSSCLFDLYGVLAAKTGLPSNQPVVARSSAPLVGDGEFDVELNRPSNERTMNCALALIALPLVLPVLLARSLLGSMMGLLLVGTSVSIGLSVPGSDWQFLRVFPETPLPHGSLLGYGPGNLTRMVDAFRPCQLLELWWSLGLMLGLIPMLALMHIARKLKEEFPPVYVGPPSESRPFYLAGIFGLLVGLLLRMIDLPVETPSDEILRIALFEVVRSLSWFALFGLLERIQMDRDALVPSLVAAFLCVLLFGGFIAFGLFIVWMVLPAFILGAILPARKNALPPLLLWLRVPIAVGLLAYYAVQFALPGIVVTDCVRDARRASQRLPGLMGEVTGKTGAEKAQAATKADRFLANMVMAPLGQAVKADPGNSALWLENARWARIYWKNLLVTKQPEAAATQTRLIVSCTEKAIQLDPRNLAGSYTQFEAFLLFVTESTTAREERFKIIDRNIKRIAEKRPTEEVQLRLRLVRTLIELKEPALAAEGLKLLKLNREGNHGTLTEEQRKALVDDLRAAILNPPQELLDEWIR